MAKRKKDFLPKRVGRVKIPKRIRRGVLGAAIASGAGQAILAGLVLKAGEHIVRRAAASDHKSPETWIGGPDAGHAPAGTEPPAAAPRRNGVGPATTAPRGATLNVKHALGQAALAFVLGLSHPPAKARSGRPAPKPERLNGLVGDAGSASTEDAPRRDGREAEKLGAHSH